MKIQLVMLNSGEFELQIDCFYFTADTLKGCMVQADKLFCGVWSNAEIKAFLANPVVKRIQGMLEA